ncbi:hypothetical protein ACQXVK_14325 [Curtobacterium sp. AB451]|uniref:hypothetical protein n=1 Tax=unclassified Curtobacterium TaxID=257496 RepID=UPI00381F59B7
MGAREDWWDDPGDDLELHPERPVERPARPAPGVGDLVATVLLLGAAVLVSPAAWFAVLVGQLAFAACAQPTPGCAAGDGDVGTTIEAWHLVLTAVVLVVGIAGSVARRGRRRTGWPVALTTLVGVLLVFAGAVVALQVASGGNLF